jgi:hypothetical protein
MNCDLIKNGALGESFADMPIIELKTIKEVYSRFTLLKKNKHFNLYPIFKRLNGIFAEKAKMEEGKKIKSCEYKNIRCIYNYALNNGKAQIGFFKEMFSLYSKIVQFNKNEGIPYQFPLHITDGMFKLALNYAKKYENDFGDEIDISAFRQAQKTNQLLSQIFTFINYTSKEIQDHLILNQIPQEVVKANSLNIEISCECLNRISIISKRLNIWEIFLRNE